MISLKLYSLGVAMVLLNPFLNLQPVMGQTPRPSGSQQPETPRRKRLPPTDHSFRILPDGQPPPYTKDIALKSTYLTEPVFGNIFEITIRGRIGGLGILLLDPNKSSSIDVFGDRAGFQTMMGSYLSEMGFPHPPYIKIQPVRPEKPDKKQRYLLEIAPADGWFSDPPRMRLLVVLGKEASGPHRLVVMNERGVVVRVIPLEPAGPCLSPLCPEGWERNLRPPNNSLNPAPR